MANAEAERIVHTVVSAFPDISARPTPEEIEAVMRPLRVVSCEIDQEIYLLLRQQGKVSLYFGISSWLEANDVVSGTGPEVERRIQFLLMDTCTCVLDHLPKAIEHAAKPVDPRVMGLLKHDYLQRGKPNN